MMTDDALERWLEATLPDGPDREARAAVWRARFADPSEPQRWFVRFDPDDGRLRGFAWLSDTGPKAMGLAHPRTPDLRIDTLVAELVDEAVPVARSLGADTLELRFPTARDPGALLDAIARTGGVEGGGRIEFEAALDELPQELPASPLTWHGTWSPNEIAACLATVATGPDGIEGDAYAQACAWVADPNVVVELGAADRRDVALVCATVLPDGGSTLLYLGLAPDQRGRGLGHVVHRHGLALLREVAAEVSELIAIARGNHVVMDRLTATGVLSLAQAESLGTLGYVARASGMTVDARWDHPLTTMPDGAAYPDMAGPVVETTGDVLARFMVRAREVTASAELVAWHLDHLSGLDETAVAGMSAGMGADANLTAAAADPPSGLGIVEAWRGTLVHRVELAPDGTLSRVRPMDPSFFNWPALPIALKDTIVPDFPLTNKSFNQSYAGNDL